MASATETNSPMEGASVGTATKMHDFQKTVNKRLDEITDRQDHIQTLSMWVIHHKNECQQIAACWLSALKRAKLQKRLHLFYLANDIVQNCKKKNAKIYLLAFKNVLKDAVVLVRDPSVAPKIERIFSIWEERNTYFPDFINELKELIKDREKVTAHVSATNFKPQDAVDCLSKVKMLESHVMLKYKQVSNLKIDASKIEAVKQLKDRSHSEEFAKQFDDSYNKMSAYVKILENEVEQRTKLVQLLENGQTFYEVQNDDALVVVNAYRNFGIRIKNLKRKLDDYKNSLKDDTESPLPSPSAEAPSPGNTPPQSAEGADDADMDMEMSDTENNAEEESVIIAAEPPKNASLTDRLAAMESKIPGHPSTDPRTQNNALEVSEVASYNPAEQLNRSRDRPPPVSSGTKAMDLLSSLIPVKPSPALTGQSVLKHLEAFAQRVKNPPPASWSDYKKKKEQEERNANQRSDTDASISAPIINKYLEQQECPSIFESIRSYQETTDDSSTVNAAGTVTNVLISQKIEEDSEEQASEVQSSSWPPESQTDITETEIRQKPAMTPLSPPPLPSMFKMSGPALSGGVLQRPPLPPVMGVKRPSEGQQDSISNTPSNSVIHPVQQTPPLQVQPPVRGQGQPIMTLSDRRLQQPGVFNRGSAPNRMRFPTNQYQDLNQQFSGPQFRPYQNYGYGYPGDGYY